MAFKNTPVCQDPASITHPHCRPPLCRTVQKGRGRRSQAHLRTPSTATDAAVIRGLESGAARRTRRRGAKWPGPGGGPASSLFARSWGRFYSEAFPTVVRSLWTAAGCGAAWDPHVLRGAGEGGAGQQTLFLRFFPSSEVAPFLCSRRSRWKRRAGESDDKPFLWRHSPGKRTSERGKMSFQNLLSELHICSQGETRLCIGVSASRWAWERSRHSRGVSCDPAG